MHARLVYYADYIDSSRDIRGEKKIALAITLHIISRDVFLVLRYYLITYNVYHIYYYP